MKIFLLTHERELLRPSNTGGLAKNVAPEIVERIIWARNTPDPFLLDAINHKNAVLLYHVDDTDATPIESFENIILLDATWQEAQKIFNKSPYLKTYPKLKLNPGKFPSINLDVISLTAVCVLLSVWWKYSLQKIKLILLSV